MNGIDTAIVKRADRLGELALKGEDLIAACSSISAKEEKDLQLAVGNRVAHVLKLSMTKI